jgi:integrase
VVADLSGEQRYYLYLTAISTGFRASELRSLCRADFNLKSQIPHILLASKNSKNRKETQQPIHAQTASELAAWLNGKPAKPPLWPGLWHKKAAKMLRADLAVRVSNTA